jgi:hypothetical protein
MIFGTLLPLGTVESGNIARPVTLRTSVFSKYISFPVRNQMPLSLHIIHE